MYLLHSGVNNPLRRLVWFAALVLFVVSVPPASQAERCKNDRQEYADELPIIFVHGGSGSGGQFEAQALRFASNGYPQSLLRVLEYDSSAIEDILPDVFASLDVAIDRALEETGQPQVNLIGHSLGTFVSQSYLAFPARAARVAHYVNVDGRPAAALPGGVPTLALWAGAAREVQGEVVGGTNVTLPDQEHVEVATSAEAFREMFLFFTGDEPRTTRVVPDKRGRFPVSGRAVIFPQNQGAMGSTVAVWKIHPYTGRHIGWPVAVYAIDEGGEFGPFWAKRGERYEFALHQEGAPVHRIYYEPFVRADHLVRLNTSVVGGGIGAFIERGPEHVALNISRGSEFWGDRGPEDNDVLSVNGVNLVNEVSGPSGFVGAPTALFFFDKNSDGESDLYQQLSPFDTLGFLSAIDVFIPAAPRGTLAIHTVPRGQNDRARTIHIPSWPSSETRITLQLSDID